MRRTDGQRTLYRTVRRKRHGDAGNQPADRHREGGGLKCLDAKMGFDGNALSTAMPDILARSATRRKKTPKSWPRPNTTSTYIALDGEIGCMVNGAGLAMATMDIIKLKGAEPANFLGRRRRRDCGREGDRRPSRSSPRTRRSRASLVNIFGGIMRCDVIAEGVVSSGERGRV